MLIMILFANSWNPRLLFLIGFGLHTYAGLEMARFDMNVSLSEVAWAMGLQGFGVGWLWVPMSLVIFSNLDPRRSAEGAALFHFVRSIASSYYISASIVVVFHTQKMSYSELVQWINPVQQPLEPAKRDGRLEYREHDRTCPHRRRGDASGDDHRLHKRLPSVPLDFAARLPSHCADRMAAIWLPATSSGTSAVKDRH